jgi:hypothetical protein
MDRQKILDKIELGWHDFNASFEGLSDELLQQPASIGEWSVKDILGHVSTWEEEALKYLPHILHGDRIPRYSVMYGGIDAFNALTTEKDRKLPLSDIRSHLDETHQKLVTYIQSLPEEQFARETRIRRRIRLDTYGHYPVHTQAIREWRTLIGK